MCSTLVRIPLKATSVLGGVGGGGGGGSGVVGGGGGGAVPGVRANSPFRENFF